MTTISGNSGTLQIDGDGWKKIDLAYTVTANTVLEFDFSSNSEGEIHGIGFDNDDSPSFDKTFRLYGTQNWGIGDFDTYTGSGPKHYKIRVGDDFTGNMQYLTFINDHDIGSPTAQSTFSNIEVYESLIDLDVDSNNDNGLAPLVRVSEQTMKNRSRILNSRSVKSCSPTTTMAMATESSISPMDLTCQKTC